MLHESRYLGNFANYLPETKVNNLLFFNEQKCYFMQWIEIVVNMGGVVFGFGNTVLLCIHCDVVGIGIGAEKSLLLPATPWCCTGNKTVVQLDLHPDPGSIKLCVASWKQKYSLMQAQCGAVRVSGIVVLVLTVLRYTALTPEAVWKVNCSYMLSMMVTFVHIILKDYTSTCRWSAEVSMKICGYESQEM